MAKAITFITNNYFTIVDDGYGHYTWSVDIGTAPPVMVGTAGDDVFASEAMDAERAVYSHGNIIGYVSTDGYGNYTDPDAAKVANVMIGGAGSDFYEVDNINDQVIEDAGALGTDTVATNLDGYTLAANVENLEVRYGFIDAMNAGLGNDLSPTSSGSRIAYGNDLANVITAKLDFNLDANAGDDALAKTQVEFTLYGGAGNDTLIGASGDDSLYGGTGADTMKGGKGNDIYEVDNTLDAVVENANEGYDIVNAKVSYTLAANVEEGDLDWASTAAIALTGNDLDNELYGNAVANTLVGGKGNDHLAGGWGNDTLQGGDGDDVLIGNGSEGRGALPANLSDTDTLDGGNGDDLLVAAGLGKDVLLGGAGNDILVLAPLPSELGMAAGQGASPSANSANMTLNGGAGDDIYILHPAALVSNNGISAAMPTIVEAAGGGNDTIFIETDLTAHVGALTEDQINTLDNGNDYTSGAPIPTVLHLGIMPTEVENLVADQLTNTAVEVFGNASNNLIVGSNSAIGDYLAGGAGNDTLDGRAGADMMLGGDGNDTYIVDDESDSIHEAATGGVDTVLSTVDYALSNNVENLTLYGAAVKGSGNDSANVIVGNANDNNLFGYGGDDKLLGGAGSDRLYGQLGNDTLDGGVGNDSMYGGAGNDIYFVDSAGDKVFEFAGEGNDTVTASVSYSLVNAGEVESLVLAAGKGNINAIGNSYANTLTGNEGNNILNDDGGIIGVGLTGNADTMIGGAGNDTYTIHNIADKLVEVAGAGNDWINDMIGSVHSIDLSGTAYANIENVYVGTGVGVRVTGSLGDNTLESSIGADTFVGGAGNDTYWVQSNDVVVELAAGGTDTIYADSFNLTLGVGIGANVENGFVQAAAQDCTLTGDANANTLGDTAGMAHVATLVGGNGSDTYMVYSSTTVINEASGTLAGTADIVHTYFDYGSTPYWLADNVEQLTVHAVAADIYRAAGNASDNIITGVIEAGVSAAAVEFRMLGGDGKDTMTGAASNDFLVGGNGADTLKGLDGNDVLVSGDWNPYTDVTTFDTAVDTLIGGKGDDVYHIKNGDVVTELAGEGYDILDINLNLATLASTVNTTTHVQTFTYSMAANFEDMFFSDITNLGTLATGATSRLVNLVGTANADAFHIGHSLVDGVGMDPFPVTVRVDAGAGNDILEAAATAYGGAGSVTLAGGLGDDTYVIDGNIVSTLENAGEGTDTVVLGVGGGNDVNGDQSVISYTLGANIENLRVGTAADWAQDFSHVYNDSDFGAGFADYYNHGATTTDFILVGNGLANMIVGSSGDDTLDGGGGADVLVGGDGDDTYIVDNSADRIIEDVPGSNSVHGDTARVSANSFSLAVNGWNVENAIYDNGGTGADDAANITLVGNNLDNTLVGGNNGSYLAGMGGNDVIIGGLGVDEIHGGAGDDTIYGGGGNDHLYGGLGHDHFILKDTDSGTVTIHSFNAAEDSIEVDTTNFGLLDGWVTSDMVAATRTAAAAGGLDWAYEYDPTSHVGEMYHWNGSSWDNTTHFDFDGKAGFSLANLTNNGTVTVNMFEIVHTAP